MYYRGYCLLRLVSYGAILIAEARTTPRWSDMTVPRPMDILKKDVKTGIAFWQLNRVTVLR